MEATVERRIKCLLHHFAASRIGVSRQLFTSTCLQELDESLQVVPVPPAFARLAILKSRSEYEDLYKQSITDPDSFWSKMASQLYWHKAWDSTRPVCNYNFDIDKGRAFVEWFRDGYTNVCYNALDKHVLAGYGNQMAILWEGNDLGQDAYLSYNHVLKKTCQLANYLRSKNVRKGDRVCIYMPMIPELPIAMLACARIGAIHSVIFAGFSAESLAGRIIDSQASILLTCSAGSRGNKVLYLKEIVDQALELCTKDRGYQFGTCLVYDNNTAASRESIPWKEGRDFWWQDVVSKFGTEAYIEWMEAEEPLFLLYTSGSTGKPKGLIHTVGGYMVYAGTTFKYGFDHQPGDIFWCTADCGWITGHTYVAYGPLFNCATVVIFEGIPTWPNAGRWWQIVDKFRVSILYTAPTAIRTLEAHGDEFVQKHSRASLRLLGSAGEPISPKTWNWYFNVVGERRCPIVDTWWQTETGAMMIAPLPGAWAMKPGSASFPFFSVQPAILDQQGKEQDGPCEGYLCIKAPWPGIARTIYGDHSRYEDTYFSSSKGYFTTGDGCRRDSDGYIWITGRVDDVINVSGHRISTGEIESALLTHSTCTEAAVVDFDHDVKGQGIYAFVTLMIGTSPSTELKKSLQNAVKTQIGAFAIPEIFHWAPAIPKTRSGKIMRRILRKIAAKSFNDIGDTSSLADPSVVAHLIETRDQAT